MQEENYTSPNWKIHVAEWSVLRTFKLSSLIQLSVLQNVPRLDPHHVQAMCLKGGVVPVESTVPMKLHGEVSQGFLAKPLATFGAGEFLPLGLLDALQEG